jgi:hypothetical protein
MKYSEMDWGTMEAVVNKLGGMDGVQRFLRGEVTLAEPAKRWREQDGVIYFTLPPTDGTTGPEWIKRLEKKNFRLSQWATDVLKSKDFKPTTGVVNEVAVLKGMLFENSNRTTKNIRAEADKRKLNKPNAEVACLIRENFSNEEIEANGPLVYRRHARSHQGFRWRSVPPPRGPRWCWSVVEHVLRQPRRQVGSWERVCFRRLAS